MTQKEKKIEKNYVQGPRWASWNIGIFLCIRCAGIHRNLGNYNILYCSVANPVLDPDPGLWVLIFECYSNYHLMILIDNFVNLFCLFILIKRYFEYPQCLRYRALDQDSVKKTGYATLLYYVGRFLSCGRMKV